MARNTLKNSTRSLTVLIVAVVIVVARAATAGTILVAPTEVLQPIVAAVHSQWVYPAIPSDGEPDPEDDPVDLQDDGIDCGCGGVCPATGDPSAGPGLHLSFVSGNVWTRVPILEIQSARGPTIELTLYYDSIRSHLKRSCGYGWSHSLEYTWYAVEGDPQAGTPDRVVIVDGSGRRRAYAEVQGAYGRPVGANMSVMEVDEDDLTALADNGDLYRFNDYKLSTITTAFGLTTIFHYSPLTGMLTSVADGYGRYVYFTYDENLRLETITDPANNVTILSYDPSNPDHLMSIEDPEGQVTSFEYEIVTRGDHTLHRLSRETLQNGNYFTCTYDDTANAMSRTILDSSDPPQPIISVASDNFIMVRGQTIDDTTAVTVTDDRGESWEYERDKWWHLTRMTPPVDEPLSPGEAPPFATAAYGDDATNHPEEFARLVDTTDTLLDTRFYTYNDHGIIESITNEAGHTTTFAYEHAWDHDGDGGAQTLALPVIGLLTEEVLPGDEQPTWEYVYDSLTCDLTEIRDPIRETGGDAVISYGYTYYPSLPGRLQQLVKTDRNGYTTTWQLDTSGNIDTKIIEVSATEPSIEMRYEHDELGRLTRATVEMNDEDDVVTKFQYDKMGRLTAVTRDPDPGNLALTTAYGYDEHGLLETVTSPNGTVTKYEYDHRNRLWKVTEDFGQGRLNYVTEFFYAADGTITVVDPRGNSTAYEFDPRDFLSRVVDAEGYETLYEHDTEGQLIELNRGRAPGVGGERDIRTYGYDGLGRMAYSRVGIDDGEELYPTGLHFEYPLANCGCGAVSGSIPRVEQVGPPDSETTYLSREFDLMGRVERVTRNNFPYGDPFLDYDYDSEGRLIEIDGTVGATGEKIKLNYDGAGRLRERSVLAMINGDPPQETWLETFFAYDPAGNLKKITFPNGHELIGEYDVANRLRKVRELVDQTLVTLVEYTYDDNDNVLTRTDGLGNTWTYDYDNLDRLVMVYDPLIESPEDKFIRFDYDEMSNLTAMFDRKGTCTRWKYDDLNRVVEQEENAPTLTQPMMMMGGGFFQPLVPTLSTRTHYEYDGSYLVKIRDHDGNATEYDFNQWGLVERIRHPDGGYIGYTYSGWAYPQTRVDQNGVTTQYDFDVQGLLRWRYYNLNERIEGFAYDDSGRLTGAFLDWYTSPLPLEVERTYDLAGRITSESLDVYGDDATKVYSTGVEYAIDALTHTADWTLSTPAGRSVVHRLDRLLRLCSVHDANNANIGVDWFFDGAGRRSTMLYRNNTNLEKTIGHDENDRTTSIELTYHHPGGDTTLWGENYGYDAEGNRVYTERLHEPGWSEVYDYDSRHRLRHMYRGVLAGDKQSVQTPLVHDQLASHQHWRNLDRRGNWLDYRATLDGVDLRESRTRNGANEYTTFDVDGPELPQLPVALGYDNAGNLTSDPTAANWGDASGPSGQDYVYDWENRLIEVKRASDQVTLIEYDYDALGRRIHTFEYYDTDGNAISPPRVTRHVYFGMEVIEEYTIEDFGFGGAEQDTLAREFIWGDTARFPEPLAMIDHTDAGDELAGTAEVLHYLHDALGSIVALLDTNGEVVERYTYDPYGSAHIEAFNVWVFPPSFSEVETSKYGNPYRWTGQRYDETVGLYSFYYRHYSPRHGRWLQRDPLGHAAGDVNFYQYVLGAPMFFVDPLGLSPIGHHWVPQAVARDRADALSEKAMDVFWKQRSGPTDPGHNARSLDGVSHSRYNREVGDALDDFMREHGINKNNKMTEKQAEEFVEWVTDPNCPNKRIRDFNKQIKKEAERAAKKRAAKEAAEKTAKEAAEKAAKEAAEKAAKEAAEKAAKEAAEKGLEKGVKRVVKKGVKAGLGKAAGPISMAGFFVYDWYDGGFGYAVNEATWPLSELWTD